MCGGSLSSPAPVMQETLAERGAVNTGPMLRQMADRTFRDEQWEGRYDEHVAPLNHLVDRLPTHDAPSLPPYVPPHYRPDRATMIGLLSDPGPMAGGVRGSGFISYRNDDQTAERLGRFSAEAGVDPDTVIPWNAYPWFSHEVRRGKAPTVAMVREGLGPLRAVLDLVPAAQGLVAFGRVAARSVAELQRSDPGFLRARRVRVLDTYHPSRQALQCQLGSPQRNLEERQRREAHIVSTIADAAR